MNYQFTIPQSFPQMTVKSLARTTSSLPVRSGILRTKKHVNGQWRDHQRQSPVQKGDQIQLIFDADDYPEKELQPETSLVEELYQDEYVIIISPKV